MTDYDLKLLKDRVYENVREATTLPVRQYTVNDLTVLVAHATHTWRDDEWPLVLQERMNL